jgi:hypothetical protein
MHGASNTGALSANIGCARPASVTVILRAMPTSRPRGLRATMPPAATAAICKPQHDPNIGKPRSADSTISAIWSVTAGSLS